MTELNLDKRKITFLLVVVLVAAIFAYFGQSVIHSNKDAVNIIVTVFSVLAGFLIAVITLIGDPKSLPPGSWRVAELARKRTYNSLKRHSLLFISYLSTLTAIFASTLLNGNIQQYLEHFYLFTGTIAGIYSFKLPMTLIEIQDERIQHEIDERKKKDNT